MKLIEIFGINVKLIEKVESYSFFSMNQRKKFADSITVRDLHLERLQLLHTHCTDVKNRIIVH